MHRCAVIFMCFALSGICLAQDYRWDRGMELYHAGDVEGALKRFVSLAQDAPDVYQYHLMAGRCFVKLNRIKEAMERFEHARDLAPEAFEVAFDLTRIHMLQRDYDAMSRVIESVDEDFLEGKDLEMLLYLRGLSRYHRRIFLCAASDLTRIQDEDLASQAAYTLAYCCYRAGKLRKALRVIEGMEEDAGKANTLALKVRVLWRMIEEAKNEKERENLCGEAVETAEKLTALEEEKTVEYDYSAGRVALLCGNLEKAATWLERASEQDHGYASYYLSITYLKLERHDGALAAARKAQTLIQDDPEALKNLHCTIGFVSHAKGDFETAIRHYEQGNCPELLDLAVKGEQAKEKDEELDRLIDLLKKMEE